MFSSSEGINDFKWEWVREVTEVMKRNARYGVRKIGLQGGGIRHIKENNKAATNLNREVEDARRHWENNRDIRLS